MYLHACMAFIYHTGKTSDPVKINSVTISPDPPKGGKDLTVSVNVTLCKSTLLRVNAFCKCNVCLYLIATCPGLCMCVDCMCYVWYAAEKVTEGQIALDLKASFIHIDKKLDLCDAIKDANMTCPIQAGVLAISLTETIPKVPLTVSSLGQARMCVCVCALHVRAICMSQAFLLYDIIIASHTLLLYFVCTIPCTVCIPYYTVSYYI